MILSFLQPCLPFMRGGGAKKNVVFIMILFFFSPLQKNYGCITLFSSILYVFFVFMCHDSQFHVSAGEYWKSIALSREKNNNWLTRLDRLYLQKWFVVPENRDAPPIEAVRLFEDTWNADEEGVLV